MTLDEEKELIATVKRLEASLQFLALHAQAAFFHLGWPTVAVASQAPPRPHAVGVPPAGMSPSR